MHKLEPKMNIPQRPESIMNFFSIIFRLDGMVPLENISEMMRALGYYPTNKEIENMMNEVKYS
jgi:Ca2+-binding EF-hand superfamily protein